MRGNQPYFIVLTFAYLYLCTAKSYHLDHCFLKKVAKSVFVLHFWKKSTSLVLVKK